MLGKKASRCEDNFFVRHACNMIVRTQAYKKEVETTRLTHSQEAPVERSNGDKTQKLRFCLGKLIL